ncbi:hypothetical protein AOQ84DRAFT_373363 [Glonium stellatum]|uniref:Uncharacterized protein n=1 Tax=Glonium stellatum TaxID=574774 RepID=A0A8E2F7U0_9PEZI|nr:hypothetical protein AOQ84DRAFT_373363 [Glonium stellatum]
MCYHGGPSTTTTAGVAWGVPVSIMELGPHLEAYVETKPVVDMLRLCNRFGQGPDVHINKLPHELILMIEEELQKQPRRDAFWDWDEGFACFEGRCEIADHFDREEIEDFEHEIMISMGNYAGHGCTIEDCDCADRFSDTDESLDDDNDVCASAIAEMMKDSENRFEVHWNRRRDWQLRVCQHPESTNPNPIRGQFGKYDKVLESDFGLKAVISHQRIKVEETKFLKHDFDTTYDDPPKTTICYLIIPTQMTSEDSTCHDLYVGEDAAIDGASVMSTVIDPSSLIITEKQRLRFGRAMRLLGLKPFVHFTQLRSSVPSSLYRLHSVTDKEELIRLKAKMEERVKQLENSRWPKLMSLVTSNFSYPI